MGRVLESRLRRPSLRRVADKVPVHQVCTRAQASQAEALSLKASKS